MQNKAFRFAWRVFSRSPYYSVLNILGLAVGIAVAVILLLYLQSDLTFDKHYPNYERTYRFGSRFRIGESEDRFAGSGLGYGPLLKQDVPEIEAYVRVGMVGENTLIRTADHDFYEDGFIFADSTYFKVFPLTFIYGNPSQCLREPNQVVLTASTAKRFFGDANPMGKLIRTNHNDYLVSAVVEDVPHNSHLKFSGIFPSHILNATPDEWVLSLWSANTYTYLLFSPGYGPEDLMQEFGSFYDKYMRRIGDNLGGTFEPILERLDKIHFDSSVAYDLPRGNKAYLYAFGAIGLLILFLACINYTNMATARSGKRAREIGVRKVLGSSKRELVLQFLGESMVLAFMALFLALVAIEVLLKMSAFNQLINKELSLDFTSNPLLLGGCLGITTMVGLLSGLYPAFFLASINPIAAIKGTYKVGKRGLYLRRVLVGFQFTMSLTVVVIALNMLHQMKFIAGKDLGFDRENVVLLPIQDTLVAAKIPALRERLKGYPEIKSSAAASTIPGNNVGRALISVETETGPMENHVFNLMVVGQDYLETMNIPLLAGEPLKDFNRSSLHEKFLVNEAAVQKMGWTQPLGKQIILGRDDNGNPTNQGTIVGVVKDFNTHSLHQPVEPMLMGMQQRNTGYLHVRLHPRMLHSGLQVLEKEMTRVDPDRPVEFTFLDESLKALYNDDSRQSKLIAVLTYITILISSLGLLGLASYSTELRFKEIGVRKVLGASANQIIFLLYREVFQLVLVAMLLASPLAYFLVNQWLENFAYTAPINWVNYLQTAVGALVVAYAIIYVHTNRAAKARPVVALKYE